MHQYFDAAAIRAGLYLATSVLLLSSPAVTAQSVHRCVVDGRTVFQQAPCTGSGQTVGQEIAAREQAAREARAAQDAAILRIQQEEQQRRAKVDPKRILQDVNAQLSASAAQDRADPANPARVCRATIATIVNQHLEEVVFDSERDGSIIVAYTRKGDSKLGRSKCKISGSSVMWGSEPGRWREHPLDEKVSFRVEGSTLVIQQRFSDGPGVARRF